MFKKIVLIVGYFAVSAGVVYEIIRGPQTENTSTIGGVLILGLFIFVPLIATFVMLALKNKNKQKNNDKDENFDRTYSINNLWDNIEQEEERDRIYNPAYSFYIDNVCHDCNHYGEDD